MKVLIGITPRIFYIRKLGRPGYVICSDVYLTEHCGILKKILPEDIVLADRGFDIADCIGMMRL